MGIATGTKRYSTLCSEINIVDRRKQAVFTGLMYWDQFNHFYGAMDVAPRRKPGQTTESSWAGRNPG